MSSVPRTLLIAALLGVIVACLGALWSGSVATRQAAAHGLARRSIDELALLAGVADDQGKLLRDEPMAVEVIADGGPLWVLDVVERAVERSSYFAVSSSPHLLRAEIIDERAGVALQLHLWRGGWELREPEPRRVQIAAWAAVVAGLLGAVAATYTRKISVGLVTAGVFAQLLLALDPPPRELFPPQSTLTAWAEGPLFGDLLASIRAMSPLQVAIAAAVIAACLVLVAFDHRRSRGQSGDVGLGWASVAALLGTVGAVAWIEAASRGSLFAACDLRFGAWSGWLAAIGLIVAWLPAIRVGREAWQAHRAPPSVGGPVPGARVQ
jgi:hypothetical protein